MEFYRLGMYLHTGVCALGDLSDIYIYVSICIRMNPETYIHGTHTHSYTSIYGQNIGMDEYVYGYAYV